MLLVKIFIMAISLSVLMVMPRFFRLFFAGNPEVGKDGFLYWDGNQIPPKQIRHRIETREYRAVGLTPKYRRLSLLLSLLLSMSIFILGVWL